MAILRSNKEQKIKLEELNPLITCELCKGYLIKPTTIAECLHTFCRSCIVQNLQDSDENICPQCSTVIHETNPFDMLRSDQILEDIIFKLVPGLQENSEAEEPPQKRHKSSSRKTDNSDDSDSKQNFHRDDPQIGVCLQYLRNCDEEQELVSGEMKNNSRVEHPGREQMSESTRNVSKMNGTMWELVRKYIRCSSRTTIGHIKKYLKLKLKLSAVDQVEVMCNGEIMGKDHTLEFVFMTRWRIKGNKILTLQYRPKLDFL
ncbi:polycomb group RING finger protein 5-A-like isoform X2 [Porites lutea]|uniref:polycomb group RING finger protein 5-A-like isoform X2 n=1 Tax=Porites lutea TaxID=51062 RepID=UPI003CC64C73